MRRPPPGLAARGPGALSAYLTERAEAGIAMASSDGDCCAIRHVHRMPELPDPVASETVREVLLGLRRTHGTAPRQLARPLSTDDIRQIVGHLDRSTPPGIRDAALILLGHASIGERQGSSPLRPTRHQSGHDQGECQHQDTETASSGPIARASRTPGAPPALVEPP